MQKELKSEKDCGLLPWIERFLVCRPYLSRTTRKTYRYTLIGFVHSVNQASAERRPGPVVVTQETVVDWLRRQSTHTAFRTLSLKMIPLRRFLAFLETRKVLREDPFRVVCAQYPRRGLRGVVRALIGDCPQEALKALVPVPRFSSPLSNSLQDFLTFERALGKRYQAEEHTLITFDAFLNSYPQPPPRLSAEIVTQWRGHSHRLRPNTQYQRFMLIRKFCIHLRRSDPTAYVPPPWNGRHGSAFIPHIYSRADVERLLKAAHQLKASSYCPLRSEMSYLLIALLYTAGLRRGEALKLRLCDINWDDRCINIRDTKFFKSRVVPLSPSMMKALDRYLELCHRTGIPSNRESPLFQNVRARRAYSGGWAGDMFRVVCERAGLWHGSTSRLRLHDLRHSFAVHRLEDWYRAGGDVQSKLGLLSTYMGHTGLAGTQRYLTMTPELLQHASDRFERFFHSQQKEISQ